MYVDQNNFHLLRFLFPSCFLLLFFFVEFIFINLCINKILIIFLFSLSLLARDILWFAVEELFFFFVYSIIYQKLYLKNIQLVWLYWYYFEILWEIFGGKLLKVQQKVGGIFGRISQWRKFRACLSVIRFRIWPIRAICRPFIGLGLCPQLESPIPTQSQPISHFPFPAANAR